MWVFILVVPAIFLTLSLFLALVAWKLFAPRRKLQIAATGAALVVFALIVLAFFGFALRGSDSRLLAFAWSFFGYAVAPLIYLDLLAAAALIAGKIFPRARRFKLHCATGAALLVAAVCIHGFWKFAHPQTTFLAWNIAENRAEIVPAETANAPTRAGTRKMRIVATADWHLGKLLDRARAEQFVALVNAQNPDLVLVVGDLIDADVAPLEDAQTDEILRQIRAPLGVLATLGNHEYYGNLARDKKFIRRSNMRLLLDNSALVDGGNGTKILFVGRDDATNRARRPISKILAAAGTEFSDIAETPETAETAESVPEKIPIFVLDHQPKEADAAVAAGANFVFCGHTHDGQFWPVTWLVHLFHKYVSGLYTTDAGTPIYVTFGLGLWHIPYRVGSHSELVVIDVF